MHNMKKLAGWVMGALVLTAPIATATEAAATVTEMSSKPATAPAGQKYLHTGELAVNRFVWEMEHKDGKDYVNIKFTGDHSADVQIMPDGMTKEGQDKVDQIDKVLKLNGYDDVHYWAVL